MSKNLTLRVVGFAGACAIALGSGCNLLPFATASEQTQVGYVRSFVKGLTPTYNRPLGVLLREMDALLGYNLPSKYGVDVGAYFMPFPPVTPANPAVRAIEGGDANHELQYIQDQGGQLQVLFPAVQISRSGTTQTDTYTLNVNRTPTGTTGQLVFNTSGTNWVATPGGSAGWVLGQGQSPEVPSGLAVAGKFVLPQSAGTANLQANLLYQQSTVPHDVSFQIAIPNALAVSLTGIYSSTNAAIFNGTVAVKGNMGLETYQAQVTASSGTVQAVFLNQDHQIRFDLRYANGLLTGTAKATDGRQYQLAKFSQAAGQMPSVDYGDGTHDVWTLSLPPN